MGTWNIENMGASIVTHKHRLLPLFLLERICAVSDVSNCRIKAKHGKITFSNEHVITVYTSGNKGKVLLRYWVDNFASYMTSQNFNRSIYLTLYTTSISLNQLCVHVS